MTLTSATPTPRRWFQFRLRTLLIAITALGVLMGWFTNRLRRAERQRDATAKLAAMGFQFDYDWNYNANRARFKNPNQGKPEPTWLRRVLGNDFFDRIVAVRGGWPSARTEGSAWGERGIPMILCGFGPLLPDNAAALRLMQRLKDLRELDLGVSWRADGSLPQLAALSRLRTLSLSNLEQTEDFRFLEGMPELEALCLGDSPLNDETLVRLLSLRRLKDLRLWNTKISGERIECLNELALLETLSVVGTRVRIADLGKLKLPRLRRLDAAHPSHDRWTASDAIPADLFDGMPCLERLSFATWPYPYFDGVSDNEPSEFPPGVMAAIVRLPNLTTLDFSGTELRDSDLEKLDQSPRLQTLNLYRTRISDAGLQWLRRLPALRTLYIESAPDDGRLSTKGLAELQHALPKLTIINQNGI